MADFNEAFELTKNNEGGYVNDPDDLGGETFVGISRRWNPGWHGWILIDQQKDKPGFPNSLNTIPALAQMVYSFYKTEYWDRLNGNAIPSQRIANELFDTAVNLSCLGAVRFLQIGLNFLNRDEKIYPDLLVDGILGKTTLAALNKYLNNDIEDYLLMVMNGEQLHHYVQTGQEKFARGWLKNRVSI